LPHAIRVATKRSPLLASGPARSVSDCRPAKVLRPKARPRSDPVACPIVKLGPTLGVVVLVLATAHCRSKSVAPNASASARLDAASRGCDPSNDGGCGEHIAGRIPCGPHYCDARSSYCEIMLSDAPELPSTLSCRPLPESCKTPEAPACSCFPKGTRCSGFCSAVDTGSIRGFRLTCVGGY